jgi:hypothetical protein
MAIRMVPQVQQRLLLGFEKFLRFLAKGLGRIEGGHDPITLRTTPIS